MKVLNKISLCACCAIPLSSGNKLSFLTSHVCDTTVQVTTCLTIYKSAFFEIVYVLFVTVSKWGEMEDKVNIRYVLIYQNGIRQQGNKSKVSKIGKNTFVLKREYNYKEV